jgi:hypothetical protein
MSLNKRSKHTKFQALSFAHENITEITENNKVTGKVNRQTTGFSKSYKIILHPHNAIHSVACHNTSDHQAIQQGFYLAISCQRFRLQLTCS